MAISWSEHRVKLPMVVSRYPHKGGTSYAMTSTCTKYRSLIRTHSLQRVDICIITDETSHPARPSCFCTITEVLSSNTIFIYQYISHPAAKRSEAVFRQRNSFPSYAEAKSSQLLFDRCAAVSLKVSLSIEERRGLSHTRTEKGMGN